MKALNLGCGSTFHPGWENLDIESNPPYVKAWDIRKKLPFKNNELDVCYSSHVLEHLTPVTASHLMLECFRVLKPQGIIRVAVPNLEMIVRSYLIALEQAEAGDTNAKANYEWMMLELYDQAVRNEPGGKMGEYLLNSINSNYEFVRSRIGLELDDFLAKSSSRKSHFWARLWSMPPSKILQKIRFMLVAILVHILAGEEVRRAFDISVFRMAGEIHQWMYDRFSLRQLLEQAGFTDVRVCQAQESRIVNFDDYGLDVVNGMVRKPDSLFMEAIKP